MSAELEYLLMELRNRRSDYNEDDVIFRLDEIERKLEILETIIDNTRFSTGRATETGPPS